MSSTATMTTTKQRLIVPHHHSLPSFYNEFIRTNLADDLKEGVVGRSLLPSSKWWHGIFVFSLVSLLACLVTLWAPYPIGSRVPAEYIAAMPFSNGCSDALKACICPRATICADDLLSMILLTIARSSAWFNYPLYMMMFLSKAKNLANLLQKSVLKCWINFSDLHHVHSLFGSIVGLESMSHTFFHILRWARRKEDIQVSKRFEMCVLLFSAICFVDGDTSSHVTCFFLCQMTASMDEQNRHHGNDRHRRHSIDYIANGGTISKKPHILRMAQTHALPLHSLGDRIDVSCPPAYLLAYWCSFRNLRRGQDGSGFFCDAFDRIGIFPTLG